jgi:hypothetical protein
MQLTSPHPLHSGSSVFSFTDQSMPTKPVSNSLVLARLAIESPVIGLVDAMRAFRFIVSFANLVTSNQVECATFPMLAICLYVSVPTAELGLCASADLWLTIFKG